MQYIPMIELDIFSRPAHLITRACRLFIRIGDSRLHKLGFSTAHIPILAALRNGEQLTQKDLARFAQIEQPTMAQTLARMERDGLILRQPDPADKRSSLISLRPVASEKMNQILEILAQGNQEALKGFDETERAALADFLRRIVVNLEIAAG